MAKKISLDPYLLCLLGTVLMAAGFLMGPFPVLVFAGLAPAFALADFAEGEFFWNKLELVLIILFAGYFCAHGFSSSDVVPALLQAITTTLAFAAFSFSRQSLGSQLGRIPLLLFMLTLEYITLKLGFGNRVIFLADVMKFKSDWVRWTTDTGYLGISLWILFANHLLYLGALREGLKMPWLIGFLVAVLAPIIYSYTLNASAVDRETMLLVYDGTHTSSSIYTDRGEWIPRTAAWVSSLILVFAFVKSYIQKK